MSTTHPLSPSKVETKVSRYDHVSAWLIAAIIVLGVLMLVMASLMLREHSFGITPPPPWRDTPTDIKGPEENVPTDNGFEFRVKTISFK